jgi:RNA polymerase sigma-70 factor (ECF subfamily)
VDDVTRLALAARDGDRAAALAFVRATQPDVWRLCRHLGRADADDLTQETYVRAFRSLPRFRAESSARVWLLSIARRVAADAVRTASRRRRLDATVVAQLPVGPDVAEAVAMERLVAGLDPDRRAAFVMTQVLGLTYDEAAVACGCQVGTIRSRVARARGQLIAAWQAGDPGDVADGGVAGVADA